MSNDQKLIALLMGDKYFNNCLGAFECKYTHKKHQTEPIILCIAKDRPGGVKDNFREDLSKTNRFKQIFEI